MNIFAVVATNCNCNINNNYAYSKGCCFCFQPKAPNATALNVNSNDDKTGCCIFQELNKLLKKQLSSMYNISIDCRSVCFQQQAIITPAIIYNDINCGNSSSVVSKYVPITTTTIYNNINCTNFQCCFYFQSKTS